MKFNFKIKKEGAKKMREKLSKRSVVAALMALVMALGLTGCGTNGEKETVVTGNGEMPKSLSIFSYVSNNTAKAGGTSRGDVAQYKIAEERTGCKIEWKNVDEAAVKEQFNLMLASGDYPDLINYTWNSVEGGASSFVDDGVIVPISDYYEYMPNFKKFVDENPEIMAQFTDEKGRICFAPCLRADDELRVFVGPIIREDWLDKLGLEMPTNTDELYEVLKAFKTQDPNGNGKADEIPFTGFMGDVPSFGVGNIVQSFDAWYNLYVKDGKITHGMIEPEMKEALSYLSKLYKEGLLDPDYMTHDFDSFHAKINNERSGFAYTNQPSRYYDILNDGTKKISGVPYFNGKSYNSMYMSNTSGSGVAITTTCKDPAGAARWIDYFYSEEGITTGNYGIEGKTYDVVDGKNVLKMDYFDNNPDGYERSVAIAMNIEVTNTNFAGIQLWDAYSQTLTPWGKEAISVWADADVSGALPNIPLTAKEKDEIANIKTEIDTYSSSLFNSIIIGNKPLSELDKAEKELKKLGLDKLLEVYNAAYKRFNAN